MQVSKKRIIVIALALTLMVTSALPAFAANNIDTDINRFTVTSVTKYITPREKQDTSSCYVRMTDINTYNRVMVNVFGQTSNAAFGATKVNCNNGTDDRVISVGQAYFLLNTVKEKGYGYATLGFSRAVTSNYEIQGVWSPDSVWQSGVITM